MRFTDNIVKRFGADKLLHLCVAGWLVSMSSILGWLPMLVMSVLVIILSVIKEMRLDVKRDWKDLYVALIGIAMSWLIYILTIAVIVVCYFIA